MTAVPVEWAVQEGRESGGEGRGVYVAVWMDVVERRGVSIKYTKVFLMSRHEEETRNTMFRAQYSTAPHCTVLSEEGVKNMSTDEIKTREFMLDEIFARRTN